MASTTPNLLLPYPQSADNANPPQDFLNLANRVEAVVVSYYVAASTSAPTSTYAGLLWYQTDTLRSYFYTAPGTSYLVADGSLKPFINVYRTANQSMASGTNAAVTVVFDGTIGSALGSGSTAPTLNTSTGVVTVNKTGIYQINTAMEYPASMSAAACQIVAGGNTYTGNTTWVNSTNPVPRASASITVALTSGQTVAAQAVYTQASSFNLHGGTSPYVTYMNIAYLNASS